MKGIFSFTAACLLAISSFAFAADAVQKPNVSAPAAKPIAVSAQEVVNINTADVHSLTKLKGVGAKKAEAIVAYRKANGSFKSIDQLAEVKGVGAKILDANRKSIRI